MAKSTCLMCGQTLAKTQRVIDTAAFARLARMNFDARPADLPGSYAASRKKKVVVANG